MLEPCAVKVASTVLRRGFHREMGLLSDTTMFGIVSEIERDLLKSRVKEGLDAAKARGVKLGRKPGPAKSKLDPHKEMIQEYLDKEISKASIAKLLGVHKQTLYSYIKKYKMVKSDLS